MIKTSNLYILATILIISDQLTKFIVKGVNFLGIYIKGFYLGESVNVFGDFFTFTFVENPGMAWGIEFGAGKILLSLFSVFASIALIWYLGKIIDDNAKLKFKLLHFNKVMRSKSALSNKEFLDTFIKLDEWGFNEKK